MPTAPCVFQALASTAIHAVATVPSDGPLHSVGLAAADGLETDGRDANVAHLAIQLNPFDLNGHGGSVGKLATAAESTLAPTRPRCDARVNGNAGNGGDDGNDGKEGNDSVSDHGQRFPQNSVLQRLLDRIDHLEKLAALSKNNQLQTTAVPVALQERGVVDALSLAASSDPVLLPTVHILSCCVVCLWLPLCHLAYVFFLCVLFFYSFFRPLF
jgi:hypothetical protein